MPEPKTYSAPDPEIWPACSDCDVAYVHRRMFSLTKGWIWAWQQDCKHGRKGSPQPIAVLVTDDGRYELPEDDGCPND